LITTAQLEGSFTRKPKKRKPVLGYLKAQGRFRHLLNQPEVLAKIQKDVDEQ
jgi:pyruvate/2-oxoacid:ferredoxin oxidoreductase beta subunit